jgi:hypothetical protein
MADIKETAFGSFEQCNRRWENGDMICEMVVHWHNPDTGERGTRVDGVIIPDGTRFAEAVVIFEDTKMKINLEK